MEDLILEWNMRFPYDRKWRKKYNVPFGSEKHLQMSQIDIYFDLKEDKVFDKYEKKYSELDKNREEYKKTGRFLKEQVIPTEKEDELIEKLKFSFRKKKDG